MTRGRRAVALLAAVALGLVGCGSVATRSPADVRASERLFDAAIPALMTARAVPGVAIGLVRDGEASWAKGYGWADRDRRVPATAHTVFQAASISKSVSAWVVMKLVEDGRLDLDASVARALTRWQLPRSAFDDGGVSVRRALSHTAGLSVPGYFGFPPGVPLQNLEASLDSAADANREPLRVTAPPGTAWRYSGGGYTLMQLAVEQASGRSFADVAKRTVLEPLGMQDSGFEAVPSAVAYDSTGKPVPTYRFTAQAAAGLFSSAADLARFVAALMPGAGGAPPGRGVLAPATVQAMLSAQPHSANDLLFAGSEWGLGYGLTRLPSTGEWLAYHPGDNIPAWHGLIAALPARRAGFVVLTNGEAGRELRLDAFCLWLRSEGAGPLPACEARRLDGR